MRETVYVVRIGKKLYVEGHYRLYPATTPNIISARFFTDLKAAEKMAKKTGGEVIPLTITDEL